MAEGGPDGLSECRRGAPSAGADDPGAFAMGKLKARLEQYDFPVVLAAEWGIWIAC